MRFARESVKRHIAEVFGVKLIMTVFQTCEVSEISQV